MMQSHIAVWMVQFSAAGVASAAVDYTFTLIADSSTPGFGNGFQAYSSNGPFGRTIALNDNGLVAFYSNSLGIHVGNGGPVRLIAGPANGYLTWLARGPNTWVSLNNSGQVAFVGGGTSPTGVPFGVWRSDGLTSTLIEESGNNYTFSTVGPEAAINDQGQVAYVRRNTDQNPGVFLDDGVTQTKIVGRFEDPNYFQILGARAVNNAGQVAFFGDEPQDNFAQVFRGDRSSISEIALVGPDFSTLATLDMGRRTALETLAINASGLVAFWGKDADGDEGIFLNDGTGFTTYVDESDGFATFGHWTDGSHVIALNDLGSTAFLGTTLGGTRALFDGPSPDDIVIAMGDPLFGSTVADLFLGHEGLNDAGQLAFFARVADGREFIIRANPVPEPSALALLSASIVTLFVSRRARCVINRLSECQF